MKKVGIDARLYSQTGVGTYLKNLLFYLDQNDTGDMTFYVYLLKEDFNRVSFKSKNIIKREADFWWHTFSEQWGFLKIINSDALDLMHFTYFSYPVLYRRTFIATVHDATPLLFKTGRASTKNQLVYAIKHLIFRIILKTQVKKAVRIITPTQSVKREIVSIYGDEIASKTVPIYEGINYQIKNAKENTSLSRKYDNFFLYVGNFYPHKNVERLIAAFSQIKTDDKLLLVGPDDYFSERLKNLIKNPEKITVIKNPGLSDLVFFYKNARALIHPSLSEGFGLPVVEASYFGCPVIASNIPVFKEILDNNYLSFNPESTDDIRKKIEYFTAFKPKFDSKKILSSFSFGKMAERTLIIYRESVK